jgi:hypothetical protein
MISGTETHNNFPDRVGRFSFGLVANDLVLFAINVKKMGKVIECAYFTSPSPL